MALKHIKEYYKKIETQYFGLLARVKEFDEALKRGEVSPEQAESARQMIFKVEDNYKRWSYLLFLLNQPSKKEKQQKYLKQHSQLDKATKAYSAEEILADGEYVLKDFEKLLKEVKEYGR